MISALAIALAVAQPAAPSAPPWRLPAEPQTAIEAERAFAARAQVEGQWTAFRATAAPDAIMLAPGVVNAHEFLARFKTDPPVAVMWWPARAWVSCDATLAVTTGPWVRNGGTGVGTFTTVWRRERDGRWRWVYDNGREIPRAVEAPDQPIIQRSACPAEAAATPQPSGDGIWLQREGAMPGEWGLEIEPMPSAPPAAGGRSQDGTLRWEVHRRPAEGPNAYMFQVVQILANRNNGVPQAVGSPPSAQFGEQLVVAESHGFTASRPAPSDD